MMEVHVSNEAGVFNARKGVWNGVKSVFTHKNPKNGKMWGEDLPIPFCKELGKWVNEDEVRFVD